MAELLLIFSLLISYPFLSSSFFRIRGRWSVFIIPPLQNRRMCCVLKNPGDLCFAFKYNFFWYSQWETEEQMNNRMLIHTKGRPHTWSHFLVMLSQYAATTTKISWSWTDLCKLRELEINLWSQDTDKWADGQRVASPPQTRPLCLHLSHGCGRTFCGSGGLNFRGV